jgi:hypothetical protein
MKPAIILLAALALCSTAFAARPGLAIGSAFIRSPVGTYADGNPGFALDDIYSGAVVSAEYWPVRMVGVRVNLADLRVYAFGGGAVTLAMSPGLAVLVEPPVNWRVRPVIAVGGSMARYIGGTGRNDVRFLSPADVHFWAGPGIAVRILDRLDARAEAGIYDYDTYYMADPQFGYGQWTIYGIVVDHAQVGLTWSFGR